MENFDRELNRGVPSATEGINTSNQDIGTAPYNPDFGQRKTVEKHTHHERSYKCPQCGGEFNSWHHHGVGNDENAMCPFCSLECGSYEPE